MTFYLHPMAKQLNAIREKKIAEKKDLETRQGLADQASISQEGNVMRELARQRLGTGDMDAAENNALREAASAEIRQSTQGAARALAGRLAGQGVRGGTAAGALAGVYNQGAAQRADVARKLLLENLQRKREGAERLFQAELAGRQMAEQRISERKQREAAREAALIQKGKIQY